MTPGRMLIAILAPAALSAGVCGCGAKGSAEDRTVTIFAAASLTDALQEIGPLFEAEHGLKLRFSFASSSTLARQIEAGATPDVYMSAHPRWMDYLEEQEALDTGSRRDVLSNDVVCILPHGAANDIPDAAAWLAAADGRIAMGDPAHVPAGIYGKQALASLSLWKDVEPRLAPCANTRAALRAVELDECGGGVVYATDAAASGLVTVAFTLGSNSHEPIRYPAALCRGANDGGRLFLEYLSDPEAAAVFRRHGFTTLSEGSAGPSAGAGHAKWLTTAERQAAGLSLRVALASVLALLLPGVLMGWLLARAEFPGKGFVEAATHLPMVVPPVVTGYLLLLLLGRHGLVGGPLSHWFGLHLSFTLWAAVIASAAMAFPLMVRSVRLAIELVDRRVEEAALVCGAGTLRRFVTVTLPLAAPGILAGAVLAFSRSLGEFGATMTFAGNIPGETQTVPLAIFAALQQPGGDHSVARLALLSIAIAMAALWLSRRLERRMRAEGVG